MLLLVQQFQCDPVRENDYVRISDNLNNNRKNFGTRGKRPQNSFKIFNSLSTLRIGFVDVEICCV